MRIDLPAGHNAANKRGRAPQSEPEEDTCETDPIPRKSKKRRRKAKGPKAQPDTDTECFDIDIDIDGDDEEVSTSRDGPQSHQLKFYKGIQKQVVDLSLFFYRVYLLNVNAFPDADELETWSRNAYIAACKSIYGAAYQCA